MAHRNASDAILSLPISMDNQGSDGSIPLSPQWLLPKMGESKHEAGIEDGKNLDVQKSSTGGGKVGDMPKRKDVFRPSLLDQDAGRADSWRDEERDTNPAVRRDRWSGDRESVENRKTDRWNDKVGPKIYGESQRAVPDRRADSGNKESGNERRESKWTNRWGPNDKDKDVLQEKPGEFNRVDDVKLDKGLPNQNSPNKDEKEREVYRPWRPSSLSQSRGKGESPNPQTATPSKNSAFSYGRGRSENQSSVLGHTHGPPNISSQPSKRVSDKEENINIESSLSRYSRAMLLGVYRTMSKRSSLKLLDEFVEVPSLTQDQLADPLGLSDPSPEEVVILMGIDKGEVLSSGVSVNSKEIHSEQHSSEFSQSRKPKIGSREDLPHIIDGSTKDGNDDFNNLEVDLQDKQAKLFSGHRTYRPPIPAHEENSFIIHKSGEMSTSRDVVVKRDTYVPPGSALRRQSAVEYAHSSPLEVRGLNDNRHSRNHDFGRSQHMKNLSDDMENASTNRLYPQIEPKWQVGGHQVTETLPLGYLPQENESRKLPAPSPEDLVLFYKDPQGNIQGPFSGSDIIGWYDAGYFGIDLQVRLVTASADQPFSVLGDVMPHLKSKSRPPPGFNTPTQNEPLDVTSKLSHSSSGKQVESLTHDFRQMHGVSSNAGNIYLESMMAGPKGSFGNNASSVLPIGVDNTNLYLLAKKMALENQQRSWTGRDPTPMIPQPGIGPERSSVHATLQSPMTDNVPLNSPSQNTDLLAMLQGVSERSSSGFNSTPNTWPNFPVQDGQNIHQSSPLGIQHQILQAQNDPLLANLFSLSNPSAVLRPESLPAMTQDPQTLSILQQQYLLNLHSQTPTPLPQLSMLDKLLLLQQQQKQLEQQQLLRQHNMMSQNFPEILSQQYPNGPSLGQMQANAPSGGIDPLQYHMTQMRLNTGVQRPHDESSSELHKVQPQILQDFTMLNSQTPDVISKLSSQIPVDVLKLPHQLSKDANNLDTCLSEQLAELQKTSPSVTKGAGDGYKSLEDSSPPNLNLSKTAADTTVSLPSESRKHSIVPPKSVEAFGSFSVDQHYNEMFKVNLNEYSKDGMNESDQISVEATSVIEDKIAETRELKKGSEKKSRKQKVSKSSEQGSGVSKIASAQNNLRESNNTNMIVSKGDMLAAGGDAHVDKWPDNRTQSTLSGYANLLKERDGSIMPISDQKADEIIPSQNTQSQRAWKPAPGFKPKSLLEIQQEEQKRSQEEVQTNANSVPANPTSLVSPWAGVVSNADTKTSKSVYIDTSSSESVYESLLKSKGSKTEINDSYTKLNDVEFQQDRQNFSFSESYANDNTELTDDFYFIQAKDTKKSRKKSGKAKGASSKIISVAPEASLGSSPVEKTKSSRQAQQEVLPPVPSGPSLGDFVVWKGETASVSSSVAPAWSTDSGRTQPVLLRDILKEQGKKTIAQPTHHKQQSTQPALGSVPSRELISPTPSKAPVHMQVTPSKNSGDEDLFWGPIDTSKKDAKLSDFPQLVSHSSSMSKSSIPLKGYSGGITKQKSLTSKTADISHTYSSQTSLKGSKDSNGNQSEAMDFRDWCQAESVRLTGTKDTSFLEFCLKQTRSEAEILLVENLGAYDPKHEFIDKFLNYKELLQADVLEMAFQSQNDLKSKSGQASNNTASVVNSNPEPSTKTSGKKKGKKGKKVSPSVLGFNVVSNRIMMGEIQTVED